MKEDAVNMAISRMRGRLGELIRQSILLTVDSEEDWLGELHYLLKLLGRGSTPLVIPPPGPESTPPTAPA